MRQVRVKTAHKATYPNPIQLIAGDAVTLSGREDSWDGHRWLWAVGPDGREGWVPDSMISKSSTARYDYDARELSCNVGEVLEALSATHGWVMCRNENGASGWVPMRHLKSLSELS